MAESVNEQHQNSLKWHEKIAVRITGFVGSMFCAVLFAIIAFISLPQAIAGGTATLISWLAQTFLQLVLLSIIMVGQNLQQRHAEFLADETYRIAKDTEFQTEEIQKKLDEILRLTNE